MLRPALLLVCSMTLLSSCQPAETDTPESASATTTAPAIPANETDAERAARLQATFPAQQRAPQDPEAVARGLDIYAVNCRACHGQDLRGGDLGGPNLLRSEVVLNDKAGEEIGKVIREGRNNPGMTAMPAFPLDDHEVQSIAAYLHSVVATARGQGAPPPGTEVALNIVVGDPEQGQQLFGSMCSACHSASGDLAGLASRIPEAEELQNSWVAGRAWGRPIDSNNPRRMVTVTVNLADGQSVSGRLGRHDDFVLSLTTEQGDYRSFSLNRGSPAVTSYQINDPLARHLELMAELDDDMMHDITAYLVTLK